MGAPRHLSERLHHNDARYLRLSQSRRERQRSGFKPPRVPETEGEGEERWKATRKAKRKTAERAQWRRGTGTGLHLSKAPYRLPVFRLTAYSPPRKKRKSKPSYEPRPREMDGVGGVGTRPTPTPLLSRLDAPLPMSGDRASCKYQPCDSWCLGWFGQGTSGIKKKKNVEDVGTA